MSHSKKCRIINVLYMAAALGEAGPPPLFEMLPEQALSAIDLLLTDAENLEQRLSCIYEKKNLLFHLGRHEEARRMDLALRAAKKTIKACGSYT